MLVQHVQNDLQLVSYLNTRVLVRVKVALVVKAKAALVVKTSTEVTQRTI